MTKLNSKIILAKNIGLDSSYKNVLSYNEEKMLTLLNSNDHFVNSKDSYSFIRERSSIHVDFSYAECLQSNYIAYQNIDYSGKWFFAFIDEVNYKSEKSTEIKFTIDVWTTFYSNWESKTCFVEREHSNTDNYYENLIDEGIDYGDYIINYHSDFTGFGESHVVMGTTVSPDDGSSDVGGGIYNNIYSGVRYYTFRSTNDINNALVRMALGGKSDGIKVLFYLPDVITGYDELVFNENGIAEINDTNKKVGSIAIPIKANSINGYVPRNKKLFNYPYQYYLLDNNAGAQATYKFQDFVNQGDNIGLINIYGACTPSASIRAIPENYLETETETGTVNEQNLYGLNGAKYPICSWSSDYYTNWLTQNGINIATSLISSAGAIVGGTAALFTGVGAVAGVGAIAGGLMGITNSLSGMRSASLVPNQAEGNLNSGDITYAIGKLTFSGYYMCIRQEFLEILDSYFDRFGYKIHKTKIPNLVGRAYWNYVKIGEGEEICLGKIPTNYSKIINKIVQMGVTIWHDHINIGNFELENYI